METNLIVWVNGEGKQLVLNTPADPIVSRLQVLENLVETQASTIATLRTETYATLQHITANERGITRIITDPTGFALAPGEADGVGYSFLYYTKDRLVLGPSYSGESDGFVSVPPEGFITTLAGPRVIVQATPTLSSRLTTLSTDATIGLSAGGEDKLIQFLSSTSTSAT